MQKLFTALQIREWDKYTIESEPISSIELMECASLAFVEWFIKNYPTKQKIYIFCGPGNNGGDGLAVCRLLQQKGFQVYPYLINPKESLSTDCNNNLKRLDNVIKLSDSIQLTISKNDIIIDALFGSGLTRPVTGIFATVIKQLNESKGTKISIDIPSGMYCDKLNATNDVIFCSDIVVSFQIPKRAFFFTENKTFLKSFEVVDIGLSNEYYTQTNCDWYYFNNNFTLKEKLNFDINNNTILKNSNNTLTLIENAQKKAKQLQENITFKKEYAFIITPKGMVYISSRNIKKRST